MLIAQITDMHVLPAGQQVFDRVDTNAHLGRAVASIMALDTRPDVLLATGDLVEAGTADAYAELRRQLQPALDASDMRVLLMPGNHDAREPLREAFPEHAYLRDGGEFIHYTVDDLPVKLIALDSTIPGETAGDLCETRRAWLSDRLDERRDSPVIVALHHPPFPTGMDGMDSINCRNGDKIAEIVSRHPNVERVLAGHHHRPISVRWAGTLGMVGPATAHQMTLSLGPDSSPGCVMEPPAYLLHRHADGMGLVTHQGYVGDFEITRVFDLQGGA